MRVNLHSYLRWEKAGLYLGLAVVFFLSPDARGQQAPLATASTNDALPQFDWLKPAEEQELQTASGMAFSVTGGQDIQDPASVLSSGSLWQEKYKFTCTQKVDDLLSFSYETSSLNLDSSASPCLPPADEPSPETSAIDGPGDELWQEQTAGLQFQPFGGLKLSGNVHDSYNILPDPDASSETTGTGFSAESQLPLKSTLKLDMSSDRTGTDQTSIATAYDTSYDAQLQQPLGSMPLTAVLKGRYEEITDVGAPPSRLPSLEQSLIWKPTQDTTLQMGLRQQQYEETPGITDEFNEVIFGDWFQTILPNVSWHSYAEMVNSHGLETITSSPTVTGSTPTGSPSLSSALPVSFDDETLTFTTGPAFKLQKDLSASIQYSSRWDKNPQPGSLGEEQQVSVSLKGTF
ncbi:MAG TPA: hypothetical protein VL981_01310 [Candidatus Methylacidiphilales bacterium]|nr:hypothetical protein [Candidatus Methylacidiphilales bacterium]